MDPLVTVPWRSVEDVEPARGARGNDRLPEVLALADRCSGSPMETRLRLLLVLAGLPRPRIGAPDRIVAQVRRALERARST